MTRSVHLTETCSHGAAIMAKFLPVSPSRRGLPLSAQFEVYDEASRRCRCMDPYRRHHGQCVAPCPEGQVADASGACRCEDDNHKVDWWGSCTACDPNCAKGMCIDRHLCLECDNEGGWYRAEYNTCVRIPEKVLWRQLLSVFDRWGWTGSGSRKVAPKA
eukprot:evm.model.scf_2061.2 EVM.evm.TU.scf_2061.2   scf_2061:26371-26850(+)